MMRFRLLAAIAAVLLTVSACGNASPTSSGTPKTIGDPIAGSHPFDPDASARGFAQALLAHVTVPTGAHDASRAPAKSLAHLPAYPATSGTPVTLKKWWTASGSPRSVLAWLKQHNRELGSPASGASPLWLDYQLPSQKLPRKVALGDVFLVVAPVGHGTSGIAAFALSLKQPARPKAELVPLDVTRAVIGWRLAPGGTPGRKILTGHAATRLARDFDSLRVSTLGEVPCPMINADDNITVTFTASGHPWRANVAVCPGISVTRDGHTLPMLASSQRFLADLKTYGGHVPITGPQQSSGGATPLVGPSTGS